MKATLYLDYRQGADFVVFYFNITIDKANNMIYYKLIRRLFMHTEHLKEKITITLSPHLLKAVDRWCRAVKLKSRSAAIERLVEQSVEEQERRRLEAETEAYYLSLSEKEKEEDKKWTRHSSQQAAQRFERDEA